MLIKVFILQNNTAGFSTIIQDILIKTVIRYRCVFKYRIFFFIYSSIASFESSEQIK